MHNAAPPFPTTLLRALANSWSYSCSIPTLNFSSNTPWINYQLPSPCSKNRYANWIDLATCIINHPQSLILTAAKWTENWKKIPQMMKDQGEKNCFNLSFFWLLERPWKSRSFSVKTKQNKRDKNAQNGKRVGRDKGLNERKKKRRKRWCLGKPKEKGAKISSPLVFSGKDLVALSPPSFFPAHHVQEGRKPSWNALLAGKRGKKIIHQIFTQAGKRRKKRKSPKEFFLPPVVVKNHKRTELKKRVTQSERKFSCLPGANYNQIGCKQAPSFAMISQVRENGASTRKKVSAPVANVKLSLSLCLPQTLYRLVRFPSFSTSHYQGVPSEKAGRSLVVINRSIF